MDHKTDRALLVSGLFTLLCTTLFSFLALKLKEHGLSRFDSWFITRIQGLMNPILTFLMKGFTFIGSPVSVGVQVAITAVLMYLHKRRWEAGLILVMNVGGVLFNQVLKWVFHRQRPDLDRLIAVNGYSFPSGHSMGAIVFYSTLAYFICLFLNSRLGKVSTILVTIFLVVTIGVSRIYLGVHYPSDVVAGYVAGGAWIFVCFFAFHLIVERRATRQSSRS